MKIKRMLSLLFCMVILVSGFSVYASAADVTVITPPNRTSFYQGVDWDYNKSGKIIIIGSLDISGTVLEYNSKKITYNPNSMFGANMYVRSESGTWTTGKNTMRIFCDDFPGVYATVNVNFCKVKSVSLVSAPTKVDLVLNRDWKLGVLKDVEISTFDLSGAKIKVTYDDSTSRTISYPNSSMDWTVGDVDTLMPGKNTLYITFCGFTCGFNVNFLTEEPSYKLGDVDLNGKVNSYDALLALECSTQIVSLNSTQLKAADVNKDNKVNSSDALYILQSIVGIRIL